MGNHAAQGTKTQAKSGIWEVLTNHANFLPGPGVFVIFKILWYGGVSKSTLVWYNTRILSLTLDFPLVGCLGNRAISKNESDCEKSPQERIWKKMNFAYERIGFYISCDVEADAYGWGVETLICREREWGSYGGLSSLRLQSEALLISHQ